ncbi:MAG: SRPBCC family protein [Dehalococcoidia bacterium]|nr:SRPBCC family protein [Dehalococcoidia bacterium]
MGSVEKTIEVDVPVTTAYNQWTQFEEFPRFMEGVQEVRQLDDSRLYWKADVGGRDKEWYARILEQVPDQRVAWQSEQGAQNGGQVMFEPVDDSRTRITLNMQYEPDDFVESVGDVLGFVSRRVQADLERFKEFIEASGQETGAWRGSITAR